MFIMGNNYIGIDDHNRPINDYRHDPKDGYTMFNTFDTKFYRDRYNIKDLVLYTFFLRKLILVYR